MSSFHSSLNVAREFRLNHVNAEKPWLLLSMTSSYMMTSSYRWHHHRFSSFLLLLSHWLCESWDLASFIKTRQVLRYLSNLSDWTPSWPLSPTKRYHHSGRVYTTWPDPLAPLDWTRWWHLGQAVLIRAPSLGIENWSRERSPSFLVTRL